MGLSVLRDIPADLMGPGFTAYGGVVRDAAGRIVAHLAMPASQVVSGPSQLIPGLASASGLAANAQLLSLSEDVQQVLNVALAGTTLAGLGLATSIVGFVYVSQQIKGIQNRLDEIEQELKNIKDFLEAKELARLLNAIDEYEEAYATKNPRKRHGLLTQAKRDFGQLAHLYRLRFAGSTLRAEIELSERYFIVACLGNAMCTSDLGEFSTASAGLRRHYNAWAHIARKHAGTLVSVGSPQDAAVLLEGRYVEDLPAATLIDVLDFINDEQRGIGWLDEARRPLGNVKMRLPWHSLGKEEISLAKAMCARNHVLDSYAEHFSFLAEREVPATEYARLLEEKAGRKYAVLNRIEVAPGSISPRGSSRTTRGHRRRFPEVV